MEQRLFDIARQFLLSSEAFCFSVLIYTTMTLFDKPRVGAVLAGKISGGHGSPILAQS